MYPYYRSYTPAEILQLQQQRAQHIGQAQGYHAAVQDVAGLAYLAARADRRREANRERERQVNVPSARPTTLPDRSRSRVETLPLSSRTRSKSRHTSRVRVSTSEAYYTTRDNTTTAERAFEKYSSYKSRTAELSEGHGRKSGTTETVEDLNDRSRKTDNGTSRESQRASTTYPGKSRVDEWNDGTTIKPAERARSRGREREPTIYPSDSISQAPTQRHRSKSRAASRRAEDSLRESEEIRHSDALRKLERKRKETSDSQARLANRRDERSDSYYPTTLPPRQRGAPSSSYYPPTSARSQPSRRRDYTIREVRPDYTRAHAPVGRGHHIKEPRYESYPSARSSRRTESHGGTQHGRAGDGGFFDFWGNG